MATHSSVLAWRIPWTEGLVDYIPWGHKELDRTERLTHMGNTSAFKYLKSCYAE